MPLRIKPIPLPLAYSCTIVRSDGLTSRIWVMPGWQRIDSERFDPYRPATKLISDLTGGVSYQIDVEAGTYIEIPTPSRAVDAMRAEMVSDIEWELAGTESIDGKKYDKFEARHIGAVSDHPTSLIYVHPVTGLRRREITINKFGKQVLTIDRKDVVVGEPPADVFRLPPGLKKVRF